jgi:putative FmdB family regulatory protein
MPLYEYQCDACGHRFEVLQKFSDPRIDTCPKCGSTVHKLMSSPAIQFKGSGFYITDYRSDKYKESAKQDIAASRPPAESKPSTSESKPAAKSESKPSKSPPKK